MDLIRILDIITGGNDYKERKKCYLKKKIKEKFNTALKIYL